MDEQTAHTGENEQETPFSIDEYQELLKLLNIKLPKAVLTPDVITQSTRSDIIEDAKSIKQDLENCTHKFAQIPRLACWQVKQALQLQEKEKFQHITKMIFLREVKSSMRRTGKTLKKQWKTKTGCGFRIRDTYRETSSQLTIKVGGYYGNNKTIQKNAKDCFEFYLQQTQLTKEDVTWKQNGKLEFGFLTGKPNFLVNIKNSSEDVSPAEKIIIKCNSERRRNIEQILQPPKEGFQAQFNTCHQFYLHAQASLFILKEINKEQNVPVSAVMVLKVCNKLSTEPAEDFYWGEVNKDTEKIEQLNNCCKSEVMPRFLSLLNLIFEKEI